MIEHHEYLRENMMPHIWCKGCGNGIVMGALLRAIHHLRLPKDRVAVVSGIGCSSRLPGYLDFNTLHTTHGRALAFATGLKLARPNLAVIVITGDGDGLAIGGNHLIHAARRNIDLTCLLFNNQIYGMTGGQVAPTTPEGLFSTTTPYGNIDPSFDACRLVQGAGGTFVARRTAYTAIPLEKLIVEGIQHKGFSFIEIMTTCPEIHGRRNKLGTPAEMLRSLGKLRLPMGLLHTETRPEYVEAYEAIIATAQRAPAAREAPLEVKTPCDKPRAFERTNDIKTKYEVRLSGEGGQGIVLAGIILAEAAIEDGKNVVQTQEYGPESRGGAATSEVIISDDEIDYPKPSRFDLLLALTQEACDKHRHDLQEGGVLLADTTMVPAVPQGGYVVYRLPLLEIAREKAGKAVTANIVALGAIAAIAQPVSREALAKAVARRAPKGTEALNLRALSAGYELAQSVRRAA